jgi:hypothetical protein
MQSFRSSPPLALIFGIALILSIASLWYIRTVSTCQYLCEGRPCAFNIGSCGGYEIYAGFPLMVVSDDTGGSPLSGVGKIQFDDITSFQPLHFIGNTLFYGAWLWLIFQLGVVLWGNQDPNTLLRTVPFPVITIIGVSLYAFIQWQFIPQRTMNWVDQQSIQGYWELVEPTSEGGLILYFDPQGKIPDLNGNGEYRWVSDDIVEISVSSMVPGFCEDTLFFLQASCHTTLIDPASYPAPGDSVFPVSSYPYPAPDTILPTPTPAPTADPSAEPLHSSFTRVPFAFRIEGNRMTLTSGSMAPLTFRRVATP